MTFKVQLNHFVQRKQQRKPICFKDYIFSKLHFNTCERTQATHHMEATPSPTRTHSPLEEALETGAEQEPEAGAPEPEAESISELPVAIARMNTRRIPPPEAQASSSHPSGQRSSNAPTGSRQRRVIRCAQCEKVFSHRGDLNKHLRTHSGERPYLCPEASCGKRFAHSSNLRRHIVVHTGDKPFDCDRCGRCFNRKDKLLLHQQTRLCRKRSQASSSTSTSSH